MSLGPDFVSIEEGLFCDMDTSELWPLCTETQMNDCFDFSAQQIRTDHQKRDMPSEIYRITDEWK